MALFLVDTVSNFRIRYVIDTENEEYAADTVVSDCEGDLREFSQTHIGNDILDVREIDITEYMELFHKDNDYLSGWPEEEKLKLINK